MKIGVIADDFTGASDIALTLAEAGMNVTQYIGVPGKAASGDVDAGVVALKSRTAPVDQAVSESLAACDWLLEQGALQIVFKVCSTFDSTPEGNIGPVLDALSKRMSPGAIMVCPAFPENGRSVYQGHLFVNDVLLNESGMQDHPLTPMKDADLRRVLAAQSTMPVGHVPAQIVRKGADAVRAALPETGAAIVDAITDDDLFHIGAAAQGAQLLCGGSGIALGLPANFDIASKQPDWRATDGPGVVLSGSCSRATRAQVAEFVQGNPGFEIRAEDVLSGGVDAEGVASWVLEQKTAPLVYSSADPAIVAAMQDKFGRETCADAIEGLFSGLAALLVAQGVQRLVVAGGETSGAVVNGLGAGTLQIGPRIAAGVPMVKIADRNVALALKSGNFGDVHFFRTALHMMAGRISAQD